MIQQFKTYNLYSFITEWEWTVQTKAFCDSYYKRNWKLIRHKPAQCKRWSIWHGTISYRGETITIAEADKRMKDYLSNKANKIPSCWKENQKIAILDYQYQFWSSSQRINVYANRCDYASVKSILYPYWKKLFRLSKNQKS